MSKPDSSQLLALYPLKFKDAVAKLLKVEPEPKKPNRKRNKS